MASVQQMVSVAQNCPGFDPLNNSTYDLISSTESQSCIGCENYQKGKCVKNLFDKVLAGLDTL